MQIFFVSIEKQMKDPHNGEIKEKESEAIEKMTENIGIFLAYAAKFSMPITKISSLIAESGQLVNESNTMSKLFSKDYKQVFSIP